MTKPTLRKSRKGHVDGTGSASNVFATSEGPLLPAHLSLRKDDRPFWDAIIRARARDEWGRVELVLAWQLAQTQGDIKTIRNSIERGDRDELDESGFPSVRAAAAYVGTLIAQQLTLMRALQMVGTVVGDPVDQIPRRKAEREAEQTINKLKAKSKVTDKEAGAEEDPLLAL